jgi:DNA invertase Pin-like site-specific DNA recombinase
MLIGYARCSTRGQDLRVQRSALKHLGVDTERIYTDQGRTGRNRDRPGLREALAACRAGDTIVVTKLDRLGRSAVDLHTIARELEQKQTRISIGGAIHDPTDPTGTLFYGGWRTWPIGTGR